MDLGVIMYRSEFEDISKVMFIFEIRHENWRPDLVSSELTSEKSKWVDFGGPIKLAAILESGWARFS